jgi:tail assembly chaperone
MAPSEFWAMSPQEFWFLIEARKPPEMVGNMRKEVFDELRGMLS